MELMQGRGLFGSQTLVSLRSRGRATKPDVGYWPSQRAFVFLASRCAQGLTCNDSFSSYNYSVVKFSENSLLAKQVSLSPSGSGDKGARRLRAGTEHPACTRTHVPILEAGSGQRASRLCSRRGFLGKKAAARRPGNSEGLLVQCRAGEQRFAAWGWEGSLRPGLCCGRL